MDAELAQHLELARGGDADALAYVITAMSGFVMQTANQLIRDRYAAEDAAQEALTIACTRLAELREPEALHGWLAAIVRSVAARSYRRRRPDLMEDIRETAMPVGEQSPLDDVHAREMAGLVRNCIAGLSDKSRAVIEQHYLRGESVENIAQTLGVPVGTVKRRLHDAREQLRFTLSGFIAPDDWMG